MKLQGSQWYEPRKWDWGSDRDKDWARPSLAIRTSVASCHCNCLFSNLSILTYAMAKALYRTTNVSHLSILEAIARRHYGGAAATYNNKSTFNVISLAYAFTLQYRYLVPALSGTFHTPS